MITHIFNSSIVSGPETLVIPALLKLKEPVSIIFLSENRLKEESKRPIEYAKSLGHQVYSIPVRGRWDKLAFVELRKLLDQIAPKIVHSHDVKASLYLYRASRSKPNFKPRLVSTHHGASYRKGKIKLYEEIYVRMILPHFHLVLSVCEQDRLSMISRGISEERLKIHLNGSDRSLVSPTLRSIIGESIREKWKIEQPLLPSPDQAIFLGAVARISSEKRHDRMLKVLSHLIKSKKLNRKPVLLFFGTGAEEKRLRVLARKLNLDENVFWMGYSNTISNEMAGFDAVLSLSDGEGIPISLVEAGWAATPVIATSVGGIPDLIPSPEFGYLVEREDSDQTIALTLELALSVPEVMRRVGGAFQKRVTSKFSETAWLQRLREVYEDVLVS